MSADFTPTQQTIKDLRPFRFWCQKVLPTVYDDSLSYYELLTKVVNYLNDNIDNVNTLNDNVTNIYNAYVLLQNYLNVFVDTQVIPMVENKLDEMVVDGTLTALIKAYIDPYFDEKSDEIEAAFDAQNDRITDSISAQNEEISSAITAQNANISSVLAEHTNDITVMQEEMSTFLSNYSGTSDVSAEVADIRVGAEGTVYPSAGEAVRTQVKNLDRKLSNFETNHNIVATYGTITTNVSVGTIVDITNINENLAWGQAVVPVKKGESFTVTGKGGGNARLWALLDSNCALLEKSAENANVSNVTVFVKFDGYAVFNVQLDVTYSITYHKLSFFDSFEAVEDKISNIEQAFDKTEQLLNGYISDGVSVGTVVDINSVTQNAQFKHIVVAVKAGDWFKLTGTGGENPRLWALLDTDCELLDVDSKSNTLTNYILQVKSDGYAVFNFVVSHDYSLIYNTIAVLDEIKALEFKDITEWKTGYIATNGNVGSSAPFTYSFSESYNNYVKRCYQGEEYVVTAKGFNAPRAWCVLNNNYQIVGVADANEVVENYKIEIANDGYIIINSYNVDFTPSIKAKLVNKEEKFENPYLPYLFETINNVEYSSQTALTYEQIIAGYDALVSANSAQITKTTLGLDSSLNYTIYRYDFVPAKPTLDGNNLGIVEPYTADEYPIVYMDACIHGGERPCARAMLNLMHKIYTETDNGVFAWLRDHIHFIIIPVANPYGYANGIRKNGNGVDLNRNFVPFWSNGSSDSSSEEYRGTQALSEIESQYINAILTEIKNKNSMYMSWHTHGVFSSYDKMTCYAFPFYAYSYTHQVIANDLINMITRSGHASHNLPSNSGFIGQVQIANQVGMSAYQAGLYGIPSVCPEVMYKYYDGTVGTDYSNKVNCMNTEYVLLTVTLMYKYFKNINANN